MLAAIHEAVMKQEHTLARETRIEGGVETADVFALMDPQRHVQAVGRAIKFFFVPCPAALFSGKRRGRGAAARIGLFRTTGDQNCDCTKLTWPSNRRLECHFASANYSAGKSIAQWRRSSSARSRRTHATKNSRPFRLVCAGAAAVMDSTACQLDCGPGSANTSVDETVHCHSCWSGQPLLLCRRLISASISRATDLNCGISGTFGLRASAVSWQSGRRLDTLNTAKSSCKLCAFLAHATVPHQGFPIHFAFPSSAQCRVNFLLAFHVGRSCSNG
jgi:hypothetical protein